MRPKVAVTLRDKRAETVRSKAATKLATTYMERTDIKKALFQQ